MRNMVYVIIGVVSVLVLTALYSTNQYTPACPTSSGDSSDLQNNNNYNNPSLHEPTCPPNPTCPPTIICPEPTEHACPPVKEPTCPPNTVCPACPTSPPCTSQTSHSGEDFSTKRKVPRLIVDCFTFGHELDWLDIRLGEFFNDVDYFILMEGSTTFSSKPKPLFYLENKARYREYESKIVYVDCTQQNNSQYFQIEHLTRDCLKKGMDIVNDKITELEKTQNVQYRQDDILIFSSDLDEFPRTSLIHNLKWYDPIPPLPAQIRHSFFYYSFRWSIGDWIGSRLFSMQDYVSKPNVKWHSPDEPAFSTVFNNGGWHCSSCLTPEDLKYKIQTFSHVELNTPQITDLEHLKDSIENGKDWAFRTIYHFVDTPRLGDVPKFLLKNLDKYGYLIPLTRYSKAEVLEASLNYMEGKLIYTRK